MRAHDTGGLRARLQRGATALRMAWDSAPPTAAAWISAINASSRATRAACSGVRWFAGVKSAESAGRER